MREMGLLNEDMVLISQPEKIGDPFVITINCPDKTGLGCDLCRIMLLFGLSISKGGEDLSWVPLNMEESLLGVLFCKCQ